MTSSDPIRIFVGCAANGEDAESQAVLEYTLRKHCRRQIEITWMRLSRDPGSALHGWDTQVWATPFSGFRWAVPALCNFEGRAIYMDSDMIVMSDIAELWDADLKPGAIIAAATGGKCNRFDVALWDCAAAQSHLPSLEWLKASRGHRVMLATMRERRHLVHELPAGWNCLDGEGFGRLDDPAIRVIHYTKMSTQPHLPRAKERLAAAGQRHWYDGRTSTHPNSALQALFDRCLDEAGAAGYVPTSYVPNERYGAYVKKSYASR